MNREIKFRMWHKKSKKMFDVESINFKDRSLNMWNSEMYTLSTFSLDDVVLMQYTELHDKNGKEIYEGDIIKVDYNVQIYIFEVKYNKKEACFRMYYEDLSFMDFDIDDEGLYEVIGNIYDNPELLEGE